jgi:hypothetical protein
MCQQWFSVGGQILDVVGFLLIVREWVWAINLQGAEKMHERMKLQPDDEDRLNICGRAGCSNTSCVRVSSKLVLS